MPARRCKAEAEACGNGAGESTLFEVVHRAWMGAQLGAVVVGGAAEQLGHRQPPLAQRVAAQLLVGADLLFGHRQTRALGQVAHRLDEAQAQVFGQEADGVAAGTTAEAVVELLGRADGKAGRLLAVEGAQPHQIGAAALELDMPPHHVGNVDAGQQVLQKTGRDHTPSLATPPPAAPPAPPPAPPPGWPSPTVAGNNANMPL